MACSLLVFFIFLAFTVSPTKPAEILTIHDTNFNNAATMAVSVSTQELTEVGNSVITAETWLRNHVLRYYPSSNITHIVVPHYLLCSLKPHHHLVLPAVKNIYHSLTRWGLQSDIRVSPSFSSECFSSHENFSLKPLLEFIEFTNSTYLIDLSYEINPKFESLVKTHMEFVKKIGFLTFGDIKLVKNSEHVGEKQPFTMRKLSYVEGPLPPLIGVGPIINPPSPPSPYHNPKMGLSPSYPPHPHHNHHFHNLPPCNPWVGPVVSTPPPEPPQAAPGPRGSGGEKLWCVAKPSVPEETLQEAMDYACGEAECDEIQPNGSCYYPDTVVAHASYAFNSYWQKNKMSAGSCSFGGTAMIINSDPSFQQCRFTVS